MAVTNVPKTVLANHHICDLMNYIRWRKGNENCFAPCNKHSMNMNECQCIVEAVRMDWKLNPGENFVELMVRIVVAYKKYGDPIINSNQNK